MIDEQRGVRVFVHRGWWVPILIAALAAVCVQPDFPVGERPGGYGPFGPWSDLVAGYSLVIALRLAAVTWCAWVVTPRGCVLYRCAGRPIRIPWPSLRAVSLEQHRVRLLAPFGVVTIGRGIAGWRRLADLALAHAVAVPAGDPLEVHDLRDGLGVTLYTAWGCSAQTAAQLLFAGAVAGAIVGIIKAFLDGLGPDLGDTLRHLLGMAIVGSIFGSACIYPFFVLALLPHRVTVKPDGLIVTGTTRVRARREWGQVRAVRTGWKGWRLVTEHETLLFYYFSRRAERLRHAATQVIEHRRKGLWPDPRHDVSVAAISPAPPPDGDRGLSPAEPAA